MKKNRKWSNCTFCEMGVPLKPPRRHITFRIGKNGSLPECTVYMTTESADPLRDVLQRYFEKAVKGSLEPVRLIPMEDGGFVLSAWGELTEIFILEGK